MMRMVVAGLGYSGAAIAAEAAAAGFAVTGTARDPARIAATIPVVRFAEAGAAIRAATHLVVTAGPEEAGCPVLLAHAEAIAQAPALRWIGYLSTTGVYGDRGGAEVDEATPPAPGQARSAQRLRVEEAWRAAAASRGAALDLFRVGGIYGPGPGRSALEDVRRGTARRVVKPGHSFSRIHRDDIAQAVVAAARQDRVGPRVLHLVDDEPAPNADVVAEAARLLGVAPPPALPFEQASAAMSPMGLSFWAENRRVACAATKAALGLAWRYPTYREGLAQILKQNLRG